ncbi:MAG: ABC transporter substrate-binding protein [Actinomycetota bacterium]|nr:ABC transporter substrate-binding protein [Actinomycetota bacterium]
MRNHNWRAAVVLGVSAALALSACGGSSGSGGGGGGGAQAPSVGNQAVGKIANPSNKKGGIIKFADASAPDSVDTGDTYYGYTWNFVRLYGRALTMFTPAPGNASNKLVGDLATGLGTPSNQAKTWTFHLRHGVKFEDGTEITSADVKYGIERSTDKTIFPDGPTYYDSLLSWPKGWKGPYKSKGMNTDSAISTPDKYTVIFHFKAPFSDMNYLAMTPQTMPVPQSKDTGAKYKNHVVSSGPYMFASYNQSKGFTLKRNPNWSAATDPHRKALPDGYTFAFNVNADDIDNQIAAGTYDVAAESVGVGPAMQSEALRNPALRTRLDNPEAARLQYTSIVPTVAPLNNIHCRLAVEYAMDRTAYQTAYGGVLAGGAPTTTLMLPILPGYKKFDLYPTPGGKGDLTKAKAELKACGQPNGFSTNIAFRTDRDHEQSLAETWQQQLNKVGIKLTPKGFTHDLYFSQYAGNPGYVVSHKLGLVVNSWGADWNDGYGMLSQIVDSRVIRATGGSSNISVRIPAVDKMLDQAAVETNTAKRNALYGAIDNAVMKQAVIYPGLVAKLLLMRGKHLTNAFVNQQYGGYDYLSLGAK